MTKYKKYVLVRNACSYYNKYKGIRRPVCNCIACREKYIDILEDKILKLEMEQIQIANTEIYNKNMKFFREIPIGAVKSKEELKEKCSGIVVEEK